MKRIPCIVIVMFFLLTGCCQNIANEFVSEDIYSKEDNYRGDNQDRSSKIEISKGSAAYVLKSENIVSSNSYITIDNIRVGNLKTEIQTSLPPSVDINQVIYFDENHDEMGVLGSGYKYLIAHISVSNEYSQEKKFYLSSGKYVNIDEKNNVIAITNELRYRSDYSGKTPGKDYYEVILPPNITKEYTLVYIVEEQFLNNQEGLFYMINYYGDGSSDELKYFKVQF